MRFVAIGLSTLSLVMFVPASQADDGVPAYNTLADAPAILVQNLRNVQSVEQYIVNNLNLLGRRNTGSDFAIDKKTIEQLGDNAVARSRANQIQQYLQADYNADTELTIDEASRFASSTNNRNSANYLTQFHKLDADKNERLSINEMSALENEERIYLNATSRFMSVLSMDSNGDERVTAQEIRELSKHVFAMADLDEDGMLSQIERENTQHYVRAAQAKQRTQQQLSINSACPKTPNYTV